MWSWLRQKRLSERDPAGGWQRDLAEQREEDRAMKREVDAVLASLPADEPVAAATSRVFDLFQQWYFTFAKRNAGRLALINENIRRQIRVTALALTAIGIILAGVGVLTIKFTIDQGHERSRYAKAVQASRFDATYTSCSQSNARHNRAVAYIHQILVGQLGEHPTPQAKAAGSKGAMEFDTLIAILAPLRSDCRAYAQHAIRLPPVHR